MTEINQDTLRTLDSADALEGLITDNKDFIDSLSKLEDLKQEIKLLFVCEKSRILSE
jgi:hypothetical protein